MKIPAILLAILVVSMPVATALLIVPDSVKSRDVSESGALIEWSTNVPADGTVEYGASMAGMSTVPETGGDTISHQVQVSGLASGKKYFYRVISTDDYDIKTSNYYGFTTRLGAPSGLKVSDSAYNSVTLEWTAVDGAAKYRVYRDSTYIGQATSDTYAATGLQEEHEYSFEVSAVDTSDRESARSSPLTATTGIRDIEISFIQVSGVTDRAATVSWKTDEAAECMLLYGISTQLGQHEETPSGTEHSITLSGLSSNMMFYYAIKCKETQTEQQSFRTLSEPGEQAISGLVASDITRNSATITLIKRYCGKFILLPKV